MANSGPKVTRDLRQKTIVHKDYGLGFHVSQFITDLSWETTKGENDFRNTQDFIPH